MSITGETNRLCRCAQKLSEYLESNDDYDFNGNLLHTGVYIAILKVNGDYIQRDSQSKGLVRPQVERSNLTAVPPIHGHVPFQWNSTKQAAKPWLCELR